MAEYQHKAIESKWQARWAEQKVYKVTNDTTKPKFYVLDMFPYPSGAGLHVGHPLGYIASDIVSRFKKLKGYNVLHPMGFDSFGLPAEQYAIETGQHPAITTEKNIATFKKQLSILGFDYDWDREVKTSDPSYYKWTQWIFQQLFNAWYDYTADKARPIAELIDIFEKDGNRHVNAACNENIKIFTAQEWKNKSEQEKAKILLGYRLTYLDEVMVNWCEALGTVLANDEVKDGVSERGGYPVERKKMRQWMMRITAYAERLLRNLDKLDWSEAMKEMQRNWIGKSFGCEIDFKVVNSDITLTVFTTRPDTVFGVTYVVIAPEHELVPRLTSKLQKKNVEQYVQRAINRSERERQAEVKTTTGVFTGSYVINPFTGEKVPIWIADYVLAGYGTGVVMAVPSSDDRDYRFAKAFDLPIIPVIAGTENLENPTEIKHGKLINSGFLNGLDTQEAIQKAIEYAEERGFGRRKINYRMRDAVFSRQRYWGEPVPIYYKNGIPHLVPFEKLPLELPQIDQYKPTPTGEPPLARAKNWKYRDEDGNEYDYEHTTMPGWAGSSWYFLRYMDPQNDQTFCSKEASNYWNTVDLYIGGTEHATGHLLYSRFWNMFLYDMGYINHEEPFQKLVNQGMIQGRSSLIYKDKYENKFISYHLLDGYYGETVELHVDISLVRGDELDIEAFKKWRPEYKDAEFITEGAKLGRHESGEVIRGKFICGSVIEKMSKSKYNVVNPDDIVEKYGADTLRLYEMFLGPIEVSKPWNTDGIEGVYKFLRKLWNLFHDEKGNFFVSDEAPTKEELRILHKTIKKTEEDIEKLNLNTSVSSFMICVNELTALKCNKRAILQDLLIIISPFAPHITEELWHLLGNQTSITKAVFPTYNSEYLIEDTIEYPVSVNGKMRTKITFDANASVETIQQVVLSDEVVKKWLNNQPAKKVIVVPGKIVNVVV
ncbi:MAG: leucine--tRNA ligase [Cytophagales bacterium]|nr:leucine--tRNA ligase [Cytophagales bacterium]MDW8384543.1 leucine--tRNA ligase [Flammeovirgaceae bacterium]